MEALFPVLPQLRLLDRRQAACHAASNFIDRLLVALGVLLEQYVDGNRLLVKQQVGLVQFHRKAAFKAEAGPARAGVAGGPMRMVKYRRRV